ncbi:hypothetical protein HEQ60_01710 [Haematospirillum sp. H1815]|uniref:hypothetical protein n=1 Tax=Haematospirillum sp. H1815 TaxID=2723108 RepID=UPI00143A67E8|nr:hypothetical protein [Haematospirillum sp. H1815]NKD76489.1 hypothetical protein [Haematospirillum sp. H1815]
MIEFLIFALVFTVPFDLVRRRTVRQQRRLEAAFLRARSMEPPYGRFYWLCCH